MHLYTVAVALEGVAGGVTATASCLLADTAARAEALARTRIEVESPEREGFRVVGLQVALVPAHVLLRDTRVMVAPKNVPSEKT